ncbi:MAG: dihydrodipicolinate synthase family protein [Verrucomicrobia bacterium]|jgi:dihydrodipicolinate synthase/N-acetylneuraminate lyase|nr:dihydrodipicolinate synthase family protein [Verrucomicrobiota bacterium]
MDWLSGLVVPLLVPFVERGGIDEAALRAHLQFLHERGVSTLLINGTTGEFFSLLPEERRQVLSVVRDGFPGRVLSQVGCSGLVESLEAIRWSEALGADAIVALPPFFFADAPEEGVVRYLISLSEAARLPFVLYNFPKHAGNAITVGMLRKIPHDGIKDSGNDTALIAATPRYFAGTSFSVPERMKQGAVGFVSAQANALPEQYVAMERCLATGDEASAIACQSNIRDQHRSASGAHEIPDLKARLSGLLPGYPSGVRLPLMG